MPTAKKSPAKKNVSKPAPAKKTAPKKAVATAKTTKPQATAKTKKSTAAKKTGEPASAPKWRSIHVMGFGETMIIGNDMNGRMATSELKALKPLMASLAKKQQKGTNVSLDGMHVLNIFNGDRIGYLTRGSDNMNQRFAWADVDVKLVNKLADELMTNTPKTAVNAKPLTPQQRQKQRQERRKAMQARMQQMMKGAAQQQPKASKKTTKK